MCVNCVAQSLPYVGIALGGLKVISLRRGGRSTVPPESSADDLLRATRLQQPDKS